MDSDRELPPEIMSEILTRTSLQTLDACKAVCKTWRQLTYEPCFMPLYCRRTKNLSGHLIQTILNNKFLSTFVSIYQSEEEERGGGGGGRIRSWPYDDVKILASTNQGICCCERRKRKSYRYYACKPATQQWQPLPNPKLRYKTAGVAIMVLRSSPLRYKIVRLSELPLVGFMKQYICEIFDSKTWSWKRIQGVDMPYSEFILDSHPVVSIGESVHWLTCDDNVLTLDVSEERFDKFPLPEPVHENYAYRSKRLVEYEGRLGFSCVVENENMELWQREGTRNSRWSRKMCKSVGVLEKSKYYPYHVGFYEAIFYKIDDRSVPEVKLDYEFRYASQVFEFRSDFERVDLRGGR